MITKGLEDSTLTSPSSSFCHRFLLNYSLHDEGSDRFSSSYINQHRSGVTNGDCTLALLWRLSSLIIAETGSALPSHPPIPLVCLTHAEHSFHLTFPDP